MNSMRLAIADDHRLYAQALGEVLDGHKDPDIEVCAIFHSGNALLRGMDLLQPDLVLLDLNMPDGSGLDVLPIIKRDFPKCKVIVVTMYNEAKFIKEVFKINGEGYFLKTNPLNELITAIESVIAGDTYLSNGLKVFPKELINNHDDEFDDDFQLVHRLTPRELEILQLISLAKSNKEIAEELFISDQTVMVHRKNIMRKLSVSNTAGLIKFALDHDLS